MASLSPLDLSSSEVSRVPEPTDTAGVASGTSVGLDNGSADAESLALLLLFLLPSCRITHDFLLRGVSPRKRWTAYGGVEEVDATVAGLSPELAGLLSSPPRLNRALGLLSPAIVKNSSYDILCRDAVERISQAFSAEALAFWKTQALIVSYRACPWKYIESSNLDLSSILPHLQYATQTHGDCLERLNPAARAEYILTLLEASRFPTMEWKRSMVSQATVAMRDVSSGHAEYWYLSLRLSTAKSLLYRLEGDHEAAVSETDKFIHQQQPNLQNPRDNAAMGHLTLQRALNCIQTDDLRQAEQLLKNWRHLGDEPSLMEQVVYFRRGVTLGRVLRTLGRFSEAYTYLRRSYHLAKQLQDLTFDEDQRDLISEMADTLRELDQPQSAEEYLRMEFARRAQGMQDPPRSGKSLLEASLAEVLFAQGRAAEAERVCAAVEARWDKLMRLGKLRICIVRAKIYHTRSEHANALRYWDEAMRQILKFPGTAGLTTRTIVLSRRENLRCLGLADIPGFERYIAPSGALGKPGGMVYWITGLRHWQNYLDSEARRTRM